jgi:hypothetical protein
MDARGSPHQRQHHGVAESVGSRAALLTAGRLESLRQIHRGSLARLPLRCSRRMCFNGWACKGQSPPTLVFTARATQRTAAYGREHDRDDRQERAVCARLGRPSPAAALDSCRDRDVRRRTHAGRGPPDVAHVRSRSPVCPGIRLLRRRRMLRRGARRRNRCAHRGQDRLAGQVPLPRLRRVVHASALRTALLPTLWSTSGGIEPVKSPRLGCFGIGE